MGRGGGCKKYSRTPKPLKNHFIVSQTQSGFTTNTVEAGTIPADDSQRPSSRCMVQTGLPRLTDRGALITVRATRNNQRIFSCAVLYKAPARRRAGVSTSYLPPRDLSATSHYCVTPSLHAIGFFTMLLLVRGCRWSLCASHCVHPPG